MARTITEQTGYKRQMPQSICSDIDVLKRITEYSYDTSNRDFLKYFESRTGHYIGADPAHPQIISRIKRGLMEPLPSNYFETQCEIANMSNDEYSKKYNSSADINMIFKGRLQDCWELFTGL